MPHDDSLPQLHAITFIRDNERKKSIHSENTISENKKWMEETKEKLLAVLKSIFTEDFASELFIYNLISRAHTRLPEIILGNLAFNFTNLDVQRARYLTTLI